MKNNNDKAPIPQRRHNPGVVHGMIRWYIRKSHRAQFSRQDSAFIAVSSAGQ